MRQEQIGPHNKQGIDIGSLDHRDSSGEMRSNYSLHILEGKLDTIY